MGKLTWMLQRDRVDCSAGAGYYRLPDVKDYALNKYGLPSYIQVNLDDRFVFARRLKGLEAHLLLVTKFNKGNNYNDKRFIFNKVNPLQYNFILNYNL